jgi:hypothetical protein
VKGNKRIEAGTENISVTYGSSGSEEFTLYV